MRALPARLLTVVVLVTACSHGTRALGVDAAPASTSSSTTIPSSSSSTSPAATTVPVTPSTSVAARPAINWQGCGQNLECGTVPVPLDYSDPHRGTIELNVERRPARKQSERVGSLLVDPGGPGVAGSLLAEQASFYFSSDLLDHFDIVGWDPRGTGRSAPIDCTDDLDPFLIGADPTPSSPAAVQRLKDIASIFVAGCEARSGSMLPYVSTQASARDMDRIRRALGEAKVSYFGFSYGSELGATWATLFPATVRAAVLDGALDANAGWEAEIGQQLAGLELGFTHAMDRCAAETSCPFYSGGDPVGAYEALAGSLDAKPLVVDRHRPPVNQSVLFYAVASSLRDSMQWDGLYRALADARSGDGKALYDIYDAYVERRNDGSFSNTLEAFVAVSCLDDRGPTDPRQFPSIDARFKQIAPNLDFGSGYNYTCAQWPVPAVAHLMLTAKGAGPIVVVGTTGDPITPLESSRGLADDLEHGVLLTVEGERHTGYRINACSEKVVDAYLVDLTVPAKGTVCR